MSCDTVGGELRTVGEAAEGAKTGRSGQTYEVEARNRGLKVGSENRGLVDGCHLIAKILIEEVESLQIYLVSSRGDNMINIELFRGAVSLVEEQMDPVSVFAYFLEGGAEVHSYVADNFALCEPAGGRTVDPLKSTEAEFPG